MPEEAGIVGRHYQSCIDIYSLFLSQLKAEPFTTQTSTLAHNQYDQFERCFHVLRLWGEGFDVTGRKLDEALRLSKSLQHTTLSLLLSVSKILGQGNSKIEILCSNA